MHCSLTDALAVALRSRPDRLSDLNVDIARDWRDVLGALLSVHALHTAPLEALDGSEWLQHDPDVARLKRDLEEVFLRLTGRSS